MGNVNAGDHQQIHKGNFHDGSEGGVSAGTEAIVMLPIAHTDDCHDTVNQAQYRADFKGFSRESHNGKQWCVEQHYSSAYHEDNGTGQIYDADGLLLSLLVLTGTDSLAHKDGCRTGEAAKECNDHALNCAVDGNCCNGSGTLSAQHDID